jgi:tripartite-type tricarboxylate transporter receptor subunit TctC
MYASLRRADSERDATNNSAASERAAKGNAEMSMLSNCRLKLMVVGVLTLILGPPVTADDYPTRPITVKIAFPAGGPADVSIRTANAMIHRRFGQPLIAENVSGAAGSIGAMMVLKAKPDGYTLLGTAGTDLVAAPFTIVAAKYQPSAFKLVGLTAMADFILVSNPSIPFKNVDELIVYAKTTGNKELTLAHWGKGSTAHLVGADFQSRIGATFLEVPYKGVAPALSDLAGGHADLTFAPLSGPTLELIQSGTVKAIALASDKRSPFLPDVPTINESAQLRNFEHGIWSGIFAPADTPEPIIGRLNAAMQEWVVSAENQDRLAKNGARPMVAMDVQQAAAFFRVEQQKIETIVRSIKLDPQ